MSTDPRPPLDSAGTIATARATVGQHVTPAEGFAFDAAELDRAMGGLLARASEEGWSVDLDALDSYRESRR